MKTPCDVLLLPRPMYQKTRSVSNSIQFSQLYRLILCKSEFYCNDVEIIENFEACQVANLRNYANDDDKDSMIFQIKNISIRQYFQLHLCNLVDILA